MRAVLTAVLTVLAMGSAWAEQVRSLAVAKPAPNAERRVALVIGNSAYKTSPLRNPVNDARAMAQALTEAGFQVTLVEDAGRATMRRVIRDWGDGLARGGVGLFYFAGHGMQIRGRNYLIPVSADVQREDEVEDESVDVNTVLAKMESAKNGLNLLILDACRNNPFQRSFRSAAQGLAQMDAPSGTLIAFATAPGSVAADGTGENGLYTKHLLEQIRKPGTPVEQLFKQVRIGVTKETGDRQVPWESSSLKGDFFFLVLPPGMQAEEQKRQQQQAIDKAVGDALKGEQARAAQERTELQARMEKMIEEALAKQRALLEGGRTSGAPAVQAAAAPPVAAPPAAAVTAALPPKTVAPTQGASIVSPPAAASSQSRADQSGDRWQYSGVDADARDVRFDYLVETVGASGAAVLETTRGRHASTQWAHTDEPLVIGLARGWIVFSPLMRAQSLEPGRSWTRGSVLRVDSCDIGGVACRAQATVTDRERVVVKAGTFDTVKVVVEVIMRTHNLVATRELTYWYAPEIGRPVRIRNRAFGGGWAMTMTEPNSDFELTAYQLAGRPPVGAFDATLASQR